MPDAVTYAAITQKWNDSLLKCFSYSLDHNDLIPIKARPKINTIKAQTCLKFSAKFLDDTNCVGLSLF